MTRARVGGLLAKGLVAGAAAVIVVVATLLTWPSTVVGPTADERRIQDLQRLSHAIEAFRAKHDILPASLARLPIEPSAPVHLYDPVTNRPYDYRPLGPLAYELCARFDAALPDEPRDFWWHDAGRSCFSLETRETKKPAQTPARTVPAGPDDAAPSGAAPTGADGPVAPPAPAPDPAPPAPGGGGPPATPPS